MTGKATRAAARKKAAAKERPERDYRILDPEAQLEVQRRRVGQLETKFYMTKQDLAGYEVATNVTQEERAKLIRDADKDLDSLDAQLVLEHAKLDELEAEAPDEDAGSGEADSAS